MKQAVKFDKSANCCEVILPDGSILSWTKSLDSETVNLELRLASNVIKHLSHENVGDKITCELEYHAANWSDLLVDGKNIPASILQKSIVDLPLKDKDRSGLITKADNCFRSVGIKTIRDLINKKDILCERHSVGKKTIIAIRESLKLLGYDISFKLNK